MVIIVAAGNQTSNFHCKNVRYRKLSLETVTPIQATPEPAGQWGCMLEFLLSISNYPVPLKCSESFQHGALCNFLVARTARVGAKVGRIVRVLRLIRIVRAFVWIKPDTLYR